MASFTSLIICMVNLLQTKQVQGQAEVSIQNLIFMLMHTPSMPYLISMHLVE